MTTQPLLTAPEAPAEALSPRDLAARLAPKPALVAAMALSLFRGLAAHNPLLQGPLARTRRRFLALDRLEWRALRGSLWGDLGDRSMADLMAKLEDVLEDPTRLVADLDGRLTWIEGATDTQLAHEAAKAPDVLLKLEGALDAASADLPPGPLDLHAVRRRLMVATFELMARQAPAHADRLMQVGQRLLALAPARLQALRAGAWPQYQGFTPNELYGGLLAGWFADPAPWLTQLEPQIEATEALSAEEIGSRLATLPRAASTLEHLVASAAS